MPGQTLSFDIFANDRASETFKRLGLAADNASGDVKQLGDRLDKLGTGVTTARLALKGNTEANAELDKLDVKLIRLGNKVANPSITVEGKIKALADITAVDLALDRLNKKSAGPSIGKTLISGAAFRGLFSGGGGGGAASAATAGAPAGGPIADALISPAGIGAIAALLPIAISLTDALVGLGTGVLGAGAGALIVSQFQPAVLAPALKNIEQTLSTVAQTIGPSLGLMLVQLGKFVQSQAPQLAKFFSATLPFMQAFITLAEQAGTAILPAMTQAMQQMVKSGALTAMVQGLAALAQGIAGFIQAIGPGFKAGALIFRAIMIGLREVLISLGDTFGAVGKITGATFTKWRTDFDSWRHNAATAFDDVRHGVASFGGFWASQWAGASQTIATFGHDLASSFDVWRHLFATFGHDVAVIFDQLRHDIASAWDQIWHTSLAQVQAGITGVVIWFNGMPARILKALFGLGHSLYAFAHDGAGDFLSGLQSVGGSVLSWLRNFIGGIPGDILKFLHMSPPHAGSVFFDLGANIMHHFEAGIQSRAHSAVNAARNAVNAAGAQGGPTSASAAQAQAYARSRLSAYGWGGDQMASLIALWNQEIRLEPVRPEPDLRCVRHPAGAPAGEDGAGGEPAAVVGRRADQLGPGLHPVGLWLARRRGGP